MLYVVSAMEEEMEGLQREIEALGASQGAGVPLEFHILGVGPKRAGERMASAIAEGRRRPHGVIMLGVAGAVEPGRETGELILAKSYVAHVDVNLAGAISPDRTLLDTAEAAAAEAMMPVRRDNSLTVDHLISEGWERGQIREEYGVATVNMEDHAVAAAAADAGVPFVSVRVILDTAEQRLPGYLPKLYKSRNALFGEVLAKPWRIPTLRRLKSQMELCQSVLTRFGLSFLRMEAERRRREREKETAEAIY